MWVWGCGFVRVQVCVFLCQFFLLQCQKETLVIIQGNPFSKKYWNYPETNKEMKNSITAASMIKKYDGIKCNMVSTHTKDRQKSHNMPFRPLPKQVSYHLFSITKTDLRLFFKIPMTLHCVIWNLISVHKIDHGSWNHLSLSQKIFFLATLLFILMLNFTKAHLCFK